MKQVGYLFYDPLIIVASIWLTTSWQLSRFLSLSEVWVVVRSFGQNLKFPNVIYEPINADKLSLSMSVLAIPIKFVLGPKLHGFMLHIWRNY